MPSKSRIYFLDAFRAFAILMMLQGHFISGLLDTSTIDTTHWVYRFWLYCRGFTAPVFFTITGWIFCFLLIREEHDNYNPRIKKGIKRVVVASLDPNVQIYGKGINFLKSKGIKVLLAGSSQNKFKSINKYFYNFQSKNRPFITLKIAVSKDYFSKSLISKNITCN